MLINPDASPRSAALTPLVAVARMGEDEDADDFEGGIDVIVAGLDALAPATARPAPVGD